MTVKAKELTVGQQIQVEYGDYDNWVDFQIDSIRRPEPLCPRIRHQP